MENENAAPVEAVSEPSPMSIDDAVSAYHKDEPSEPETVQASDDVDTPEAIDSDSEPDDFALAEGEEETEGEDGKAEAEPLLANPDMVIEFDGAKVPVKELMDGYRREADYTRSKQALSQERGALQELGKNFHTAIERVTDYLISKLPPEPTPELAFQNPNLHYQMKLAHETALAEIQQVLAVKNGSEQAGKFLSDVEFNSHLSSENERLIKQMPHLKDQKRLDAFNRTVEKGAKSLGFSEEEIKTTADHRIRLMAYHAAYGIEARAKAAQAKAKIQAAPVMQPQRQKHPNSAAALERNNAMRSLKSSGSMDDAIKALMSGK